MPSRPAWIPSEAEEARIEAALTEAVVESAEVLADPLSVGAALRERLPAALARIAAERAELRARASSKLERAGELRLTRLALEQSTDRRVAAERARRFAATGGTVLDATAGIGGDAMQLVRAGLTVVAAELDPERARHLRHNLALFGGRSLAVRADAARPAVVYDGLMLDPDRRHAGARTLDPRKAEPAWSVVRALLGEVRTLGCAKFAPGFSPEALGVAELPNGATRWSWVSLTRELKELCLWCGPALEAGAPHEAVAIQLDGTAHARTGRPSPAAPLERDELERTPWLAVVDPALVRAQLVGALAEELGLSAITAEGGYLAGSERPDSPWVVPFRVLDQAPFDRKRVRQMLARHDVGPLTVKKRGFSTSAEELARRLKGKGTRPGTLIVARHAAGHHTWLVER